MKYMTTENAALLDEWAEFAPRVEENGGWGLRCGRLQMFAASKGTGYSMSQYLDDTGEQFPEHPGDWPEDGYDEQWGGD